MSMTPAQVDGMTFAAFHAAIGGYLKANSSGEDKSDVTAHEYMRILAEEKMMGRA